MQQPQRKIEINNAQHAHPAKKHAIPQAVVIAGLTPTHAAGPKGKQKRQQQTNQLQKTSPARTGRHTQRAENSAHERIKTEQRQQRRPTAIRIIITHKRYHQAERGQ